MHFVELFHTKDIYDAVLLIIVYYASHSRTSLSKQVGLTRK